MTSKNAADRFRDFHGTKSLKIIYTDGRDELIELHCHFSFSSEPSRNIFGKICLLSKMVKANISNE